MQRRLAGRAIGIAVSLAIVAGITFFFSRVLHVNQTTVALSFFLAILAVSTVWGTVVSVSMSVVAMLALNYFFLSPIGTLTIADPQNLFSLFAFLFSSIMGICLSSRVRKEADEAHHRSCEF